MRNSIMKMKQESGIALLTTILILLLMSSLLVGFIMLVNSGQRLSGVNNDYGRAFYAAEAGMEKMTADLGNLFDSTYAPTSAQLAAITATPPDLTSQYSSSYGGTGIQYLNADGSSGYQIVPSAVDSNGNPLATTQQITSGPYQGMTALATLYTLKVTARTTGGTEVKLQRSTQTVGIPMFQFGIFSDTDLSFFAGPNFNFGGRVHTNQNLFLAQGDGTTLTMSDRVTAVKNIIRTNLSNGWNTNTNYTGTVNITTSPGTSSYRAMARSEGSLTGTLGSGANPNWPNISLGATNYAGNVRSGSTGATALDLGIVTVGAGTTESIDLIRRPVEGESSQITSERYFSQASLKILLSDDPNDIMNLPCIDSSTQPFDLSQLAQPVASWPTTTAVTQLLANMAADGTTPLPLAASGANSATPGANYNTATPTDGYWLPKNFPIIKGYIKIEAQLSPYGTPCGTWKDVTLEVLGLGYAGKNIDPVPQSLDGSTLNPQWSGTTTTMQAGSSSLIPPALPNLPSVQLPYQNGTTLGSGTFTSITAGTCLSPHPNAVIRLERIRDNPSSVPYTSGTRKTTSPKNLPVTSTVAQVCGVDPSTKKILLGWTPLPTDFWPNVLFDTREGTLRDTTPAAPYNGEPTLNGVMNYIEIDAGNLAKWFAGTIGTSGPSTKDPNVAPNDFVVYISDRRGNYTASATWTGTWPPTSPDGHETGEYGWTDFVNSPGNAATGCPNGSLDTGEDIDVNSSGVGTGQIFTYGANPTHTMAAGTALTSLGYGQYGTFTNLTTTGALKANPTCAAPSYATPIWPMVYAALSNGARENPPLFFRRAVKISNGSNLTALGTCPGGVACGLSVVAENPIYVQGDYNSNSAGGGFNDPHVAASVGGDAVTLLSDSWNDTNSFSYNLYVSSAPRSGGSTYYRTAVIAGKGVSFPQPAGTAQDYGTDGGMHNFLRYIESWGGTLSYRGSIISMYYNRQATGTYKCCTTVYSPPTRGYNFDTEFLQPNLLPPRTPLFRDVNTTGFTQLLLPNQ
ncbi:MAG TPA: hypothetical protein VLX32_00345 [Candidatus Acidoferrum sp.]|nr:hypothetical protein [Candidatus Acidoferrum sp.]